MIPLLWAWMSVALADVPMTLEEAWRRAAESPDATLAAVEEMIGRAERLEARALQNPDIEYGGHHRYRGTADDINGQQHQIDVGIALPITGEYLARLKRGRLAHRWGEARADTRRALLAEAVGLAWLDLLAAQEQERIVERSAERVRELLTLARRRAEQGATRPWDVRRMELEAAAVERQLARERQERALAAARFGALLGLDGTGWVAAGSLERPVGLLEQSADESPLVAEARLAVEHERQRLREMRRSVIPEPEVRAGTLWTHDGDSASVFVGVGGALPVFDRGRGRVLRARAELSAAEAELRRVEAEVSAEIEALRSSLDQLESVARETPPLDDMFVRGAEVAWREGESGMLELVDAISADLDVRLDTVELQQSIRAAELRLALLQGRLPPLGER